MSRPVAITALSFALMLFAGPAPAQLRSGMLTQQPPTCVIKPVMTDAEIDVCRVQYRRGR